MNKGANGSPMPRPCTRRKKNPPRSSRIPHRAVRRAEHGAEAKPSSLQQDLAKDHAALWPPVPGAGQGLREAGAPHRNAAACEAGQRQRWAGTGSPGVRCRGGAAERRDASSAWPAAHGGPERPSADPHPIPPPHPGHKLLPSVKSSMPTIPRLLPSCKGKSNCPAQFGRKPGIIRSPPRASSLPSALPRGQSQ